MQYFKPDDPRLSVGDCMPFFHDGVFHLYYLLDEGHHQHPIVRHFGGHQWAHASTTDLRAWTHHPLAIPCDYTCEGSICTGSTFFDHDTYYGFYAMRPYPTGGEFLCVAKSRDGIHFDKPQKPAFGPPAGYGEDFRDPFVFRTDDGLYHMLITSRDKSMPDALDGCLLRFTSKDLATWQCEGPFLHVLSRHAPECPDLFEWNGWYYLIFGIAGSTYYRMSRSPLGPWQRPDQDMLDCPMVRVMKTAAWKGNRRIGVGWIPARHEQGYTQFAGRAVLREILQHPDGTLGTTSVAEMEAQSGSVCSPAFSAVTKAVQFDAPTLTLDARSAPQLALLKDLPVDFKVTATVTPASPHGSFGLLMGTGVGRPAKRLLEFSPAARTVSLNDNECVITSVHEIVQPGFDLEIIVKSDIVDVRIAGQRTLASTFPGPYGRNLTLFASNTCVRFENLKIVSLS